MIGIAWIWIAVCLPDLSFSITHSIPLSHTPLPSPPHTYTLPTSQYTQVMVLGQGDMGQLGLGEDIMERKRPFPVGGALAGKNVVQVMCGGMHTVALTDDGEVSVEERGEGEEREERGEREGMWRNAHCCPHR